MRPVNRGTEADPIWIMPCCGGHEVCLDSCASNEKWPGDENYPGQWDRECEYWACGDIYDTGESDAHNRYRYCSAECEQEDRQ